MLSLANTTARPVTLSGKKLLSLKFTQLEHTDTHSLSRISSQSVSNQAQVHLTDAETIGLIKYGDIEPAVIQKLDDAHRKYSLVFDRDLSGGYNGYFGKHTCKLN